MCGIYKITNLITGHSYIGQSINIERRWKDHWNSRYSQENYNKPLYRAFRKYQKKDFSFEVLEECSQEKLNEREQYWIEKFNTRHSGYNLTTGGDGTENSVSKLSEEEIFEIYDLLANSSLTQKEIANKYDVGQDVISTINHGKSRFHNGYIYPIRKNKNPDNFCISCGMKIDKESTYCIKCYHKTLYKVEHPDRATLKKLIREKTFVAIAKDYGVTDNTIRKWCKSENLPSRRIDIDAISDENWENI